MTTRKLKNKVVKCGIPRQDISFTSDTNIVFKVGKYRFIISRYSLWFKVHVETLDYKNIESQISQHDCIVLQELIHKYSSL